MEINQISPLSLAFIGDAVHTLFVREYLLDNASSTTPKLQHNGAIKYCRAKNQARCLDILIPNLTPDEQDLVRRTRNQKNNNIPKSSNIEEYKKATCFEALIGFWYLTNQTKKLVKILTELMEEI